MRFKIYRYNPETDKKPYMQDFVLYDVTDDMMLRDALLLIKAADETLTFRHSCGEGVCGSDAVNINGTNGLACKSRLSELKEPIEVRPVPSMPVIRDLVVDQRTPGPLVGHGCLGEGEVQDVTASLRIEDVRADLVGAQRGRPDQAAACALIVQGDVHRKACYRGAHAVRDLELPRDRVDRAGHIITEGRGHGVHEIAQRGCRGCGVGAAVRGAVRPGAAEAEHVTGICGRTHLGQCVQRGRRCGHRARVPRGTQPQCGQARARAHVCQRHLHTGPGEGGPQLKGSGGCGVLGRDHLAGQPLVGRDGRVHPINELRDGLVVGGRQRNDP